MVVPGLAAPAVLGAPAPSERMRWDSLADEVVERVRSLGVRRLGLLLPEGSESNLAPIVADFLVPS